MEQSEWHCLNLLGALMFGGMLFHRRTVFGACCKKACASAELETQPSENVPKQSHPKDSAPPTRPADQLGVLGWVLASVSILAGFFIIAATTIMDGEEADHRQPNSLILQQARMFRSPSNPIPSRSTMAIGGETMQSQQSHNTTSSPQQSASSEEKDTLDGKDVRRASLVEVRKTVPIRPANPRQDD